MSSRVLRKLQSEKGIEDPQFSDQDVDEFLPSKPRRNKKQVVNPFDLLNENQSSEEEETGDVEAKGDGKEENTQNKPKQKQNDTKKKRRKKQKKKEVPKQTPNVADEDIDETIQEVNKMLGIKSTTAESPGNSVEASTSNLDTRALFAVEHRNLNADSEMKRRFGAQIMRAENRQRRAHNRVYHRSSWFTTPKQSWPHMGRTGITMKLLENKNGYSYFLFEHSQSYQNTQFQFLDAVESMDPNNISAILNIHPYHVDSLLQLSEISKMGEDYQMAAELIERALYCFECSFHTLFSLTQGTCRLDYRRTENRSFFIALFQHLVFVGQRGCYRTALEFCKLIISLEPDEDPLGILLMIDFYALKAEEFSFLTRLYREWEPCRNLSQLPNFAFSVALAHFHSGGRNEKADQMLQKALIMFPSVLSQLLDKCNVVLDSELLSHSFFSALGSVAREPVALQQLVSLYVARTYHCWKAPELLDWLTSNVKVVLERVDARDPLVDECRHKRQIRYRGTPRNIHRHIILSDIKEVAASLPMEFSSMPLMSYDPLPPQDSVSGYERPARTSRQAPEHGLFSTFLRSLNPAFNAQEPGDADVHVEARPEVILGEGAEGGARPLRDTEIARGVESLMAAMRDLLNTLSYRAPPPENEDNPGQEDWDENQGLD